MVNLNFESSIEVLILAIFYLILFKFWISSVRLAIVVQKLNISVLFGVFVWFDYNSFLKQTDVTNCQTNRNPNYFRKINETPNWKFWFDLGDFQKFWFDLADF